MVLIKVRINQSFQETMKQKWNKSGTKSFKHIIPYWGQGQPMLGSHLNADSILKLPGWLCSWEGWGQVTEGCTCSFQQRAKLDLVLFLLYLKQKWLAVYLSCLLWVSNWEEGERKGWYRFQYIHLLKKSQTSFQRKVVLSGSAGMNFCSPFLQRRSLFSKKVAEALSLYDP